ncbi:hypothetical protein [Kitasatospora sp. NPDC056800]|uniref:hypothetical protein n=1 Tax=Kitasatospora sp. NPDC056800 TaxID=3345948 RepID=UPI003673EFFD
MAPAPAPDSHNTLTAAENEPATDSGQAGTTVVPAPAPDSHDTLAAAEAELATAAQALIGDPTSGLSKAVNRQLYRHTTALARGEDMLLPHLRYATADLASRRGRLRLPDTPPRPTPPHRPRRLRERLEHHQNRHRDGIRNGTVTGPHHDPPQPSP